MPAATRAASSNPWHTMYSSWNNNELGRGPSWTSGASVRDGPRSAVRANVVVTHR